MPLLKYLGQMSSPVCRQRSAIVFEIVPFGASQAIDGGEDVSELMSGFAKQMSTKRIDKLCILFKPQESLPEALRIRDEWSTKGCVCNIMHYDIQQLLSFLKAIQARKAAFVVHEKK